MTRVVRKRHTLLFPDKVQENLRRVPYYYHSLGYCLRWLNPLLGDKGRRVRSICDEAIALDCVQYKSVIIPRGMKDGLRGTEKLKHLIPSPPVGWRHKGRFSLCREGTAEWYGASLTRWLKAMKSNSRRRFVADGEGKGKLCKLWWRHERSLCWCAFVTQFNMARDWKAVRRVVCRVIAVVIVA